MRHSRWLAGLLGLMVAVSAIGFCIATGGARLAAAGDAPAAAVPATAPSTQLTAILGAFGPEVKQIEQKMTAKRVETAHGMKFFVGKLCGRDVVLAETGIGKVNAAMTTTLMIDRYGPTELLFSGIAGGVSDRVKPGDIVIGGKIGQHDFGFLTDAAMRIDCLVSPTDGQKHPKLMPCDDRLLALASRVAKDAAFDKIHTSQGERTPSVITGIIATGDVFVASATKKADLQKQLAADAVEMEGGAVVQVATQLKTPVLVIRSISDMADASAEVDMEKFLNVAAHNSAALVCAMAEALAKEPAPQQPATAPAK